MKTRKFNQYYCGVIRSAAIVAGVALLVTQVAYPASTDAIPKWIASADAPLPASGVHGATQLAQDDGAAAGATATGTAARRTDRCRRCGRGVQSARLLSTSVGGCVHHAGGSGSNGAASAGNSSAGASGNGAGGAGGAAGSGSGTAAEVR